MDFSLIVPAFVAGLLTFLAPCTLPLVPGYLSFISGVSQKELAEQGAGRARARIFVNGLLYVIGFSAVFITLGVLFGLGGAALLKYRVWLSRIGGAFVIFFGLVMLGAGRVPFLSFLASEKHVRLPGWVKPGNPFSSFMFGATFAFGWTPCVGPILGAVLTLAATTATVGQGAFLLAVFSLGLAAPFLMIAAGIGSAARLLQRIAPLLRVVSVLGGVFLIFLGILLLTNSFALWLGYFYRLFDFISYDRLLDYL